MGASVTPQAYGRGARPLLPSAAVDALPQQVGVAAVPGVLLDHVHHDVADLDVVAVEIDGGTEVVDAS